MEIITIFNAKYAFSEYAILYKKSFQIDFRRQAE